MDPNIEVVLAENASEILRNRFELPLFFIVGGADDLYLSNLVGEPIRPLVVRKSINGDVALGQPIGVYASRALLPTTGRAITFPITTFLTKEWPALQNIEGDSVENRVPNNVEQVWIARALERMGQLDWANQVRINMWTRLYPEKLPGDKIPSMLTMNTLSQLYLNLSEAQRNYPLILFSEDLPVQLRLSLGDALKQISVTGCTPAGLEAIKNSLKLLQI